jgi:hypothetical protein
MTCKRIIPWMFVVGLAVAPCAQAAPITLSDANTIFMVEPTTQQGAFSWQVDGTEHLFQEWFWYRAFPAPTGTTIKERSIDQQANGTSAFTSAVASDNDSDAGFDRLILTYTHPDQFLLIEVEYNLTGGTIASGTSTVTEKVTVTNTRPTTGPDAINATFNLFEYSDFNVNGTAHNDTATRINASQIQQTDPWTPGSATVTSLQPVPDRWEIAPVYTTLNKLNNESPNNLSNTGSPTGPADVAFAFQWTEVIEPQTTFVIQKEKSIAGLMAPVPEPGSFVLVGSGLLGLREWRRRRRERRSGA